MANPSKRKGDAAEREIAGLLEDLTGYQVRRKLGAGRQDDEGDLEAPGLDVTIQVCDWQNIAAAVRQKPVECEQQALNAGTALGMTFVRLRGGQWRGVLTLEQAAAWIREAA